jgi:uncharacterized protein (DUF302 family)
VARINAWRLKFDEAITRLKAGLAGQGFGVLTDIDVQATIKAKPAIHRWHIRPLRPA